MSQKNGKKHPQTGPRSAAGKTRSAQNATKHGLAAKRTVVPKELRAEYDAFRESLWKSSGPSGHLEEAVFAQLLHAAWNLRRCEILEEQIFASSQNPFADEEAARQLDRLTRYQNSHRNAFHRSLKELKALKTNTFSRGSLPHVVEHAMPALVDVLALHAAERNHQEVWVKAETDSLIMAATAPAPGEGANPLEAHHEWLKQMQDPGKNPLTK